MTTENSSEKYLTFQIKNQLYGVHVESVIEINRICDITKIPNTHESIKGVINLRGKVVPVIDLRLKFNIEEIDYGKKHCIIVLKCGEALNGIIVDAVDSVLDFDSKIIEPPSSLQESDKENYIIGIAKTETESVLIIDIVNCLSSSNISKTIDIASKIELKCA